MTYFKQYKPIVLGIEKASGFVKINAEDFDLYIAEAKDPTNEVELEVDVIDDDPYWWTEEFYIDTPGEYIIHWVNDDASIDIKMTVLIAPNPYEVEEVL